MKRTFTLIALALLPLAQAMAQDTTHNAYNESVYVQGDFKPVVEPSFKLNYAPSIVDTAETMQRAFSYGITPQRVTSVYNPTRLGFVKTSEPHQRLYNNYIRLGFGNYWSPLADLYYHSTRSKDLNYGAHLSHQSSWGTLGKKNDTLPSPDYYGRNHFSDTRVSLFGKYILKGKHQFSADLDYENDYNMYYGFSDSTLFATTGMSRDSLYKSIDSRSLGMMYNDLAFRLGAKSLHTDLNQFGYDASAQVGNLWGRYNMGELRYSADATLHYGFPFLKQSKGIAYLHLSFDGWNSHYTVKTDSVTHNYLLPYLLALPSYSYPDLLYSNVRFITQANPYIDFIFRNLQIHAGATLAFDAFSQHGSLRFIPFPDVVVSTRLMSDALSLNVGFTGGINPNDWNTIRLTNPYAIPAAQECATKHWDLYGHMRLTFSKKLELNARIQLSALKDDLNFRLDTDYGHTSLFNYFLTDYVSYQQATVGADLTFVNDEMLSATLAGHYYGYISETPLHYRPNWDASLTLNVNYIDKVRLHLQSLIIGSMLGENILADGTTASLPMRYGLSLEVEYLHTRALSFFAKVDNILCQRYFYWTNYPSQRLAATLGLTLTIPHK